jgi:hypothetical protein
MAIVMPATTDFKPLIPDQGISAVAENGARQFSKGHCHRTGLLAGLGALMLAGMWCIGPDSKAVSAGLTASNVTNFLGLEFVSKGPHTVCRHFNPDEQHSNRDGQGQIPIVTSNGLEDCKQKCRDNAECKGIEFRKSENRCEIWTLEIKHHLSVKEWYEQNHKDDGPADFECFTYVRNPKNACVTKIDLRARDEAGSCDGRCSDGHKCCPENSRCVPDGTDCGSPPDTCVGTCTSGWNCCIAQGNQCLKHPIPQKSDLCTCEAQ